MKMISNNICTGYGDGHVKILKNGEFINARFSELKIDDRFIACYSDYSPRIYDNKIAVFSAKSDAYQDQYSRWKIDIGEQKKGVGFN